MPTHTSSLAERVRAHGIVGAGGAGFPLYRKLERAVDTLILNAAECEPLVHKDKEILRHRGAAVLDGMQRVQRAVGARRAVIAIKNKYEQLIAELRVAAQPLGIELHPLGDYYPAGDEFLTVHEVTGRVIPPGRLPGDVGCLVSNVETLLNVGLDAPVTHKYLTVAGAVPEPMTLCVPIGASYRDVLACARVPLDTLGSVFVGGLMMGKPMASLDEVVTRTTAALVCLPPGHKLEERSATSEPQRDRIGRSACDQCSFCTELCPRYLLGHPVEPHLSMRNLGFHRVGEALTLGSQFCCECNLCSLYACPEDLFPKEATAHDKHEMRRRGLTHPATGSEVRAHSMQAYRHVPLKRLIAKLGLAGFTNEGPLLERRCAPRELRIPLRQHVGAPAVACVRVGERVALGQVIGTAPEGLGVPVHASGAGSVVEVGEVIAIRGSHE